MSRHDQYLNHLYLVARIILILVLFSLGLPLLSACTAGTSRLGSDMESHLTSDGNPASSIAADPMDTLASYAKAWADLDFAAMFQLLSSESKARIDESAFIERLDKIARGIEAANIRVRIESEEVERSADGLSASIPFAVSMDTLAGHIEIPSYKMNLLLEGAGRQAAWSVDWSEGLIFPKMEPDDKVRARILYPQRGDIRDRNSQGLAVNGELIVIGAVPGKFNAVKAGAIPKMAELLGISEKKIETALANATHLDWFYPIVTLPEDAGDLSAQLTAIDGIQYQKVQGRIYPSGAAAGLLVGYIGPITAEELSKYPDGEYSANARIGKMGLEQVYEKRLRGQAGGEIYLTAANSTQVKEMIARKEPVDGEDITLAIDSKVQHGLYSQMKSDTGAAAAIDPLTGEILALVSTPSFNPNYLQTYVPDAVQSSWNEAVDSPFANRFKVSYAPGSVFKLVTAAIGLKTGVLDPKQALPISGLKWQPDTSWGSYQVTRVKDIGMPVNLLDAFIYSDNIYFAQQALRIGQDHFTQGAAGFGIGESLPIDYPFYASQIANDNLKNPVLLADTGYGQGEVLLSPLHIAMFYSALATEGDIMAPVLEIYGDLKPQVWKNQAIDAADINVLTDALLQVVESPHGTGYTVPAAQTRMLGKTGTAELKSSGTDSQAEENGWFVAMNVDLPRLTVAMMIMNVKDRRGSHYVVPLVKQAMDNLMPYLHRDN